MKILIRLTAFLCCVVMLLSACADKNVNAPVSEPEITTEPTVTTTTEETPTEVTTTEATTTTTEATTTTVTTTAEATTTTEATTTVPVTTTEATTTTSKWKITDTNEKLYATADLNVRATPEQSGERISHVDKGDLVEVTGWVDNGWARIKFRGEERYVNGKYLSKDKPVEEVTTTAKTTAATTTKATTVTTATTADELSKINELRPDYNYRTCKNLSGDVYVFVFFMDDSESGWTEEEAKRFTENEVIPGLEFLEKQAKKHGVELNMILEKTYTGVEYVNDVIVDISETGYVTVDTLFYAAKHIGYTSDIKMLADLQKKHGPEIVCFTVFNKNGRAYAINPKRGYEINVEEHCVIFAHDLNSSHTEPAGSQASIIAHEMLHLYGAEDLYTPSTRKTLAKAYYPNDIMLVQYYSILDNTLEDTTAFYIGWTDKVPDELYATNWYE